MNGCAAVRKLPRGQSVDFRVIAALLGSGCIVVQEALSGPGFQISFSSSSERRNEEYYLLNYRGTRSG